MQPVKITYWEEEGAWIGYLCDYPDYWTQGDTLEDLREHLKDLYSDMTGGQIPGIRKVEELVNRCRDSSCKSNDSIDNPSFPKDSLHQFINV
jgi:hypothetical protein